MRLKSFHGANMADAIRQVREVLGEDAIIVATREEEGVGVRVTAAVEDDGMGLGPMPSVSPEPSTPDHADVVADVLLRHGVGAELSRLLLDNVEDQSADSPLAALTAALESVFHFQPLGIGQARGDKPLMLVGPPGAGKTLTIAKLATRATLKGQKISVISTDTVRAGGVDQLAAFTRVLKLRLMTVEDPLALADALQVQTGADYVLVDSAGRNPYNPADMKELRDFLVAAEIEPVLVLPAGIDANEAIEMTRAFQPLGVRRLLPTRLDMCRRLGSLLTIAHECELSLCEAGLSPKVAEGLVPLTATIFAKLMMPSAASATTATPKQTGTHA